MIESTRSVYLKGSVCEQAKGKLIDARPTSKRVVRLMCLLTKTLNSVAMHMPHSARVNETEGETKRSMNNESQTWLHRRPKASRVGEDNSRACSSDRTSGQC
ncbi:hypothetical protein JI435_142160 [Parastagonospora nodorum SN15]|uniref:Uncharacterized protein n=1 Tax=Phaeosphaeria nodorum (strain SN15 / ATCC MYA-4574 / FGSC 10173) TaxID=321614 RepID=A0A7U2FEY4_PHANO|nr:hypothetical protein HBI01_187900 [Parastagonospora nodorum]QRD02994.1 hypothetical protein JI435_142160 [Parastagonospora nodorum SN15]KAH4600443.1 hypothetical protein HBH82_190650 [Parastagonospora nodorum]KAH4672741.1 hypothetical protein HBH78_173420 [Parastagonospora nodorum]KAH4697049.1 hypothetical protein HBH67_184430 [Parastagonospora nodorum]